MYAKLDTIESKIEVVGAKLAALEACLPYKPFHPPEKINWKEEHKKYRGRYI